MLKKNKVRRHVLSLSGGKDSAALAVYLKNKIPDLEYVFLDTGHELPETYEFLHRMEAILDIKIQVPQQKRSFEDWLKLKGCYLPSKQKRWCTELLKIKTYEDFVADNYIYSYIGIRADEDRDGYFSSRKNIIPVYPFIEDGKDIADIHAILEESKLGFPDYYKWRSRSGCYFCFFQQGIEWINLHKYHPDLFKKAMSFEKIDHKTGESFTWRGNESLEELLARADEVIEEHEKRQARTSKSNGSKLVDILSDFQPCLICTD